MTPSPGASILPRVEAAARRDRALLIVVSVLVSGFGWIWLARMEDVCCRSDISSPPWSASVRSPIGFFLSSWREGRRGAFEMGLRHGIFCINCCWALMALCLAFGMMNLAWMAGLTAFVLFEKVGPFGPGMSRAAGALLAGWGIWLMVAALAAR